MAPVLAALVLLFPASQRPPQEAAPRQQQDSVSDSLTRGTLPVPVVNQPQTQSEASGQESRWPDERFLVVLTVVMAGTGIYQAALSRKTAKRQLRAYVGVPPGSVDLINPVPPSLEAQFQFTNFGQTPAWDIATRAHLLVRPLDFTPEKLDVATGTDASRGVLWPGVTATNPVVLWQPVTNGEIAAIGRGVARLYLVAVIEYTDCFGDRHRTEICRYFEVTELPDRFTVAVFFAERGESAT